MTAIISQRVFRDDVVFEGPISVVGSLSDGDGVVAAHDAVFTIGVESSDIINIGIQVRDAKGADIAHCHMMFGWISSDSDGNTLEATPPDALAIGTDGTLFKSGGDSLVMFHVLTEADGDIDINCTQDAADTYYLNLLIGGRVWTSGAITHAGP